VALLRVECFIRDLFQLAAAGMREARARAFYAREAGIF
jgi:hypothetical protein